MDFDVETHYAYSGGFEDEGSRPETMLSRDQFEAVTEFAAKFSGYDLGLVDMGGGYVLARLYDKHGVSAGQKLLDPPPD